MWQNPKRRLRALCVWALAMLFSSCLNPLDYQGIACLDNSVCGGLKCLEGYCGGITRQDNVVITSINGTGSVSAPTYPDAQPRPQGAQEATHRFHTSWVLKGSHLDRLQEVRLQSKSNPQIRYEKQDGLLLQEGSAAEREVMLPKNLMAGMFVLLGVIGTTEVALADVFVLQGEGCKVAKNTNGDTVITCGKTESTIKKETNTTGSGISAELKAYLETLQSMLKLDSINQKATFHKVNVHIENGEGTTSTQNGQGNLIIGYNERNDSQPKRTGSHNVVVGPGHSYDSYGGLVAGKDNHLFAKHASVLGGHNNVVRGENSSILGGGKNGASGTADCIVGGELNDAGAQSSYKVIVGGLGNQAIGRDSVVAGGENGVAWSPFSSVFGGFRNEAGSSKSTNGTNATVCGGFLNKATGQNSVVCGGSTNQASSKESTVVGGKQNTASGQGSVAIGGEGNTTSPNYSALLGGKSRSLSTDAHSCNATCP
ncbi:MAG: hypothetical protein EP343_34455 [Deltaproteobacteria bacterium]|nr:MAG: hypothetical protein EP343_34455 [Deltaproteobacteria bacterium]